MGAAEADIGQLRRERQFGRHKATKPQNLEAEAVQGEQESEASRWGEGRGERRDSEADSSYGTVHGASVD